MKSLVNPEELITQHLRKNGMFCFIPVLIRAIAVYLMNLSCTLTILEYWKSYNYVNPKHASCVEYVCILLYLSTNLVLTIRLLY